MSFGCGVLAWLVPIAAFGLAFFLAMGKPGTDFYDLLAVSAVVAALMLAVPLGIMAWQRWYHAAMAYTAGMVVGVGPLLAFLAWFMMLMGGQR